MTDRCLVGRAACQCPMEILLKPETTSLLGAGIRTMTRRGWTVEWGRLDEARQELREGCPHRIQIQPRRKR